MNWEHVLSLFAVIWLRSWAYGKQPKILYANKHDIRLFTAGAPENETTLLGGLQGVVSVDFDWRSQKVFFTEVADVNEIRSFSLKKKKQQSRVVVDARTGRPSVIAIDWVTKKLYWTDDSRTRIELANFDGTHRKLLIDTNLDQPRALALLPQKGLMFWSDWGGRPMIQRANMDGTDQKPLITEDIAWPNSLTIDMETYTVFWADAKPDFTGIYSIDYNGKNRRTVFRHENLRHPFSLTIYDNRLYWTDWKTPQINSCTKKNGSFQTVRDNIHSPMGLVAVAKERQPYVKTGCSEANGGCSHLCLLRPGGYSCACPTGIKLKEDKKTCEPALENFIVVARKPDIRIVSLDVDKYADVVLPLKGIKNAFSVDYDIVEDYIYWSDNDKKSISRAHPNGTGVQVIAEYDIHSPDGLAFDWIARNLYWTDAGEHTMASARIEVARANGTSRKILISTDLDEPRAIVVDPAEGYFYWSDWGTHPKIERAELDGNNRKVLVNTSIVWPNGIAIDYVERKLYWGDANTDEISCINLDGTNRQVILSNLPHVFGVSILGDDIFWTDWQLRKLSKANKHDKKEIQILKDQPDLMGIKAAQKGLIYGNNPCQKKNNYCSHLCLFTPSGAKCSCPLGMELDKDEKTCIVPIGFLLIMQRDDIRRITLDIYKRDIVIPLAGVREAYALDFDLSEERIYWSDVATSYKDIKSAHVNGTGLKTIIRHGLEMPVSISVDWIAKNIYWSDETAHRIEVSRLDGRHRKVLLWEDIESPQAIAVNPHNGRVFWCSAYNGGHRIEKASLNGKNRQTLLEKLGVVTSLALDYENELIYFADRLAHTIERIDFHGKNRKLLLSDVAYPHALTLYSSSIYFGDWKTRSVGRADKNTGKNRTRIMDNLEYVMDLLAYHKSRQTGTNSCARKNGLCSHLCFAQDKKNYTCGCPTHFSLKRDNKTCQAPSHFLIFSQKNNIRRVTFEKQDNPDLVLPVPSYDEVSKIDYDFKSGLMYWIESESSSIKAAMEDGSNDHQAVDGSKYPGSPFDLAVESYGGSIYWTDITNDNIKFLHFKGDNVPTVIFPKKTGYKPRNIVVSSEEGYLFWTNMIDRPTIVKSTLDGSVFVTLVDFRNGKPGDLAIDHLESRLYWIDTVKRKIESVHFSGQHRTSVVLDSLLKPRALTVYGGSVYWVDSDTEMMHRSNKLTGGMATEVHGKFRRLADIKAVNRTRRYVQHPCSVNNGQCSHICAVSRKKSQSTEIFAYEKKCACPVGYALDPVTKLSCTNLNKCTSEEFRCASDGACISKSKKCNKFNDCADGSDESQDNCGKPRPCNIPIHFDCENGCIEKHRECDGVKDCPDGRDELGCINICAAKTHFLCANKRCINIKNKCNTFDDCGDNSDENSKICGRSAGNSTGTTAIVSIKKSSATKVLAGIVSGIILSILILVFGLLLWWKLQRSKRGVQQNTDIGLVAIPRVLKLGSECSVDSADCSKSSMSTYMSDIHNSQRSELYNRNLTGTSNVTLTSNYTPLPANPPPSVITDRVLPTISENKGEPTRAPAPSMATYRSCSHCSMSSLGSLQNHKYNYMENGPPPPTPYSTDAGKDSDCYYSGMEMERSRPRRPSSHRTHRSRTRRHHSRRMPRVGSPVSVDLTDDTELLPKSHMFRPANSSMSWGFSELHIDTDHDPFAPPPTPCTLYFSECVSEDDSRPPSPAETERSMQQYPPPPSPTSQL